MDELGIKNDALDFGDLFGQLDSQNNEHDQRKNNEGINTTKIINQLKVLKRDASKQIQVKFSGYKRLKI